MHIKHNGFLLALVLFCNISCNEGRPLLGSFFVKGQFLEPLGEPMKNIEVYVQFTDDTTKAGRGYIREKAGTGITDSLGNYKFECALYGAVEYKIQPLNYNLVPVNGDTIDLGTKQW